MKTREVHRRVIGYITGMSGTLGRIPFYQLRLNKNEATELDRLLAKGNSQGRCTVTLTVSSGQPDRLRVTEVDPPDYEVRASTAYVRGDALRVHGREGVSCGIDLSARWGVPALRNVLQLAAASARQFVLLRIPSRKRDLVEILPDVDLRSGDDDALLAASTALAMALLPVEDFSDWETK